MARQTLFDHPKYLRLIKLLNKPAPHVLGHLEYLWKTGYASGNPVIGDAHMVEACALWDGEDGRLASALVSVRLIDEVEPGVYQIHDLHDHAPTYVARRSDREEERRKEKKCGNCDATYHSPEVHSRYCSERCRKADWRLKKATRGTHGTDGGRTEDAGVTHGDGRRRSSQHPTPYTPKEENTPLPPTLEGSSEFKAAWELWKQHRREIKKPLKPTGTRQLLLKFAEWGVSRAVAAIKHSISEGYQGCFEPKESPRIDSAARNGKKVLSSDEFKRRLLETPGGQERGIA